MSILKFFNCRLCVTFVLLLGFIACSEDDDIIRFTENEVVQGDILTGKQVPIPDNTVNVYATMSYTINVQNAKGGIVAVSQNEDIATVNVVNATYEAQPIEGNAIVVYGHKIGRTQISVSDSEGKTATLRVNVLDINDYFTTINTYTKISLVEDEVQITGVNDDEAGLIRCDILTNKAKEAKFVLAASKSFPWPIYKMRVLNSAGGLLYELPYGVMIENDIRFHIIDNKGETTKTYTFWYDESTSFFMEDISDDYKAQYPGAQVVLKMAVKKS